MSVSELILASSSPRRRHLLTTLGVDFKSCAADIDESVNPGETPRDYVTRMASEKASVVAGMQSLHCFTILAADTTVVIEGEILGKPVDFNDGMSILKRLSGASHQVITALCLQTQETVDLQLVETSVQFVTLDTGSCEAYLATDEPWDKAGSYAIQGLGGAFVQEIQGSYSNVVGLPLAQTRQLLHKYGIATALDDG